MAKDWTSSGVDLHLELDPSGGRRDALERALRDAIRTGRLGPGAAVPSTRALAAQLGVSRGTVTAAYDQLAAEGYLTARQGAATRVAEIRPAEPQAPRPRPALAAAPAWAGSWATAGTVAHDLRPGRPDLGTFPASAWLRSTRRVLNTAPPEAHALSDPRGRPELRAALAGYLRRVRGVDADPERIVITSGYAQALGLLARVLADAGTSAIAMEEPGHPYHRAIVECAGLRVAPLPVDDGGARTDLLGDVGAAVLTPAHQYPAGATLAPDRRRAATAWARGTGGIIVEDDYDGEFRYDRQPVGSLQGTAPGHVVYAGTASKTLAPALRLAWTVLPAGLVEPVTEAKRLADAHTPSLGQLVLADMIDRHAYDRHVRAARLRYRRRRDALVAALRRRAPHVRVLGVAAGLHALVLLPDGGPGEEEIMARAAARDLALQPLGEFWQRPDGRPRGLVVGYSTPLQAGYPAALDALCSVLAYKPRSVRFVGPGH
ncbi:MocR-like pyridoxine biosynthesis transcription factor PdxR [Actinomadura opuntiae]|uniref:MocR-like pyridoxine biosynthesis transcription factor PdxR n=1 Tax=Actinomadura sp. OS1-43 TaxID=604315 RepID=UPI00255ACFFB|nr:PLP-dependent aminotransferase family protein [Actinomadura sp. OS1-43]MDL4820606.1 PLP-dependent aminotransferase family protein [Actinomadura sp. OS1-43]